MVAGFIGVAALVASSPHMTARAGTDAPQAAGQSRVPAAIVAPAAATRARVVAAYGKLPLSFEPNVGQIKANGNAALQAQFLSHGNGYTLLLEPDQAVLRLHRVARSSAMLRGPVAKRTARKASADAARGGTAVVDMKLIDANATPKVVGLDPLPGQVNYLRGRDPRNWHTAIPTYAKVKLEQVYPRIDLVYYGNQRQLEYDFVVAPGADPRAIRMDLSSLGLSKTAHAVAPRIDRNGDLVIAAYDSEVRFRKPVVYQPEGADSSSRKPIDGQFKLDKGQVTFQVASYDRRKPLVIDPVLAYSTYINNSAVDEVEGVIAVDSAGNAYVGAETDTTDYPTLNAYQPNHAAGGDSDAVLLKLNPAGSALVYATYLGGSDDDAIDGIAVDSAGEAIVMGETCSPDFPITPGAYQTTEKAPCTTFFGDNFFITKFSASGSALIASTYLGGSVGEFPLRMALDNSANVYVVGSSDSPDFPVTPGVVQSTLKGLGTFGYGDGVVAKLDPTLSSLIYATYLGGSGDDIMFAIAVDARGNAYVTGETNSTDYPVTAGAFQTTFGGSDASGFGDAVVTKLNPTATALVYSTYLGGAGADGGIGVAVDKSGDVYVTGATVSTNFPVTPGAFQVVYGGAGALNDGDVFVAKLNPAGSALVYSTYIGGDEDELGWAIAVDRAGGAWVLGSTDSDDFPTTSNALQRFYAGPPISDAGVTFFSGDLFVLRLNPKGSILTLSTFLGGSGDDEPGGLALDNKGGLYVTGVTTSTDYPTTTGAFNATCSGADCGAAYEQFITKIVPSGRGATSRARPSSGHQSADLSDLKAADPDFGNRRGPRRN